jgi:hypothetical protein
MAVRIVERREGNLPGGAAYKGRERRAGGHLFVGSWVGAEAGGALQRRLIPVSQPVEAAGPVHVLRIGEFHVLGIVSGSEGGERLPWTGQGVAGLQLKAQAGGLVPVEAEVAGSQVHPQDGARCLLE